MSDESLRKFINSIEQDLKADTASTSARQKLTQLLTVFPHHYRANLLLARQTLASNDIPGASAAWQKVLSVEPDHIEAHQSMAKVRHAEQDLVGEIWHLSRVFESQPANEATQALLKQLYEKRDGVAPAKISLTKAAVARMYLRGQMVFQAITELNNAIAEQPDQLDLKIALLQALQQADKKDEAAKLAHELLESSPHLLEPLQFLFHSGEQLAPEEFEQVRNHLADLDPYYRYTHVDQLDPGAVADDAVLINPESSDPEVHFSTAVPTNNHPVDDDLSRSQNSELSSPLESDVEGIAEEVVEANIENELPENISTETIGSLKPDIQPADTHPSAETNIEEKESDSQDFSLPDWLRDSLQDSTPEPVSSFSQPDGVDQQDNLASNEEFSAAEDLTDGINDLSAQIDEQEALPPLPGWIHSIPPEPELSVVNEIPPVTEHVAEALTIESQDALDEIANSQAEVTPLETVSESSVPETAEPPDEGVITGHPETLADVSEEVEKLTDLSDEDAAEAAIGASKDYKPEWLRAFEDEELSPLDEDLSDTEVVIVESTEHNMLEAEQEVLHSAEMSTGESSETGTPEETIFDAEALIEDLQHDHGQARMNLESDHSHIEPSTPSTDYIAAVSDLEPHNIVHVPEETTESDTDIPTENDSASQASTDHAEPEAVTISEPVDIANALDSLKTKIQTKQDLPTVIEELEGLSKTHVMNSDLWQTLGDAYFKNNQIQKAIDAYTKAEQVLE